MKDRENLERLTVWDSWDLPPLNNDPVCLVPRPDFNEISLKRKIFFWGGLIERSSGQNNVRGCREWVYRNLNRSAVRRVVDNANGFRRIMLGRYLSRFWIICLALFQLNDGLAIEYSRRFHQAEWIFGNPIVHGNNPHVPPVVVMNQHSLETIDKSGKKLREYFPALL